MLSGTTATNLAGLPSTMLLFGMVVPASIIELSRTIQLSPMTALSPYFFRLKNYDNTVFSYSHTASYCHGFDYTSITYDCVGSYCLISKAD